ncbi:MAG: hypothetical protein II767_05270, partial [Proteobacteria bacterium]|nr:hypothetical protein [Pseudomonadota bacterium]
FLINSNAASFPEGSGSSTSMKVSLQSQPTADVKVTVSSTDASELMVSGATTLTFTTSNWKTPQDVTAKVVDDKIADGTQTAQIKFVAASTDTNFDKIEGYSATYTITDDDAPSVALSTQATTISQASPSTVASVVLGIQPSANVTVTLASDNKAITFSKSLTFTTSNWNVAQTVNVNVDFEAIATAASTAKLTAKAAGTGYNVTSNEVTLNLVKVPEIQNFDYTGNVQSTTLPPGKYKLELWGASGANGASNASIGGAGGYASGTITLKESKKISVYVGGQGKRYTANPVANAYNGGGMCVSWGNGESVGGGGATDMRIDGETVYHRLIVAGGGGGGNDGYPGGAGGGANGISANGGQAGTQTAGGVGSATSSAKTEVGTFGAGGNLGQGWGTDIGFGGGGWYGGGSGDRGGGGGSGWIYTSANYSTWKAGNATDANKYAVSTNYYLEPIKLSAGNVSNPAPAGGTETGHVGNGYARISLVK